MREIKFRVWDKGNKEDKRLPGMLKVNSIFFGKDIRCICESQERIGIGTILECAKSIIALSNPPLMQFTGLKDKNGKDIYEGDIVQESTWTDNGVEKPCLYEIYWKDDGGRWAFRSLQNVLFSSFKSNECSVVGNIFENPELLK